MEEHLKTIENETKSTTRFFIIFFKWLIVATVIGAVGGLVGTLFYKSVLQANSLQQTYPWLIYLLPVGGVAIAGLYAITKDEKLNTDTIISSILKGENVPVSLTPVIFISTVITHLFGGSAGREGAALQIGGSIGCNLGKLFKLDEKEERIAILSGMAAVFAALFGTPTTAVVFALEVCSVGIIHYSGLIPCGIAALTAFAIIRFFGIAPTHFEVAMLSLSIPMVVKVAVLAALCAILSEIFCHTMHFASKDAKNLISNPYLRAIAGGLVIIALTLLAGCRDYNGGGVEIIKAAIEDGKAKPFAFLLKMIFTAVTLGCGYKGGEIVPTFFIGATFGCVVGPLIGIPAGVAAAIGLTAMFCGAVNCPLASLVMSVELFGSENLIYFAAACFISYMLSGYSSLYTEQKIMYSKLKAEYINRKTE